MVQTLGRHCFTTAICWCLLLLLLPDPSGQQQQLVFRPGDQQWYYYIPGQQPQPLQQQQIQFGLPPPPQKQQQQQAAQQFHPQQQQPAQPQQFFFQPQQPQFQQQQPQFEQLQPRFQQPPQFDQPQQTQFQQPQFDQPHQQQPTFLQTQPFAQQQQQQQRDFPFQFQPQPPPSPPQQQQQQGFPSSNWPPPLIQHVQREPQEQQQQPWNQPQQPPPPPPSFFQQPWDLPQPPPPPAQQQIVPPLPAPRIVHINPVHIQSQQEFHEFLPKLIQTPVMAEQITQKPSTTTRRAPTTKKTTRRPATTTTRAPPPPQVKTEKETLEFDLPPPPPARFLPESEKIRIAEFLKQQNRNKNQGVHSGALTDLPMLISTNVPPPLSSTTKAPRRSALARLAATAEETVIDPNKVFLDCCKRKRVARQCESRCNFDVLNKKILTGLFLGSDKCPTEHGLDLFTCAAQDQDHSACCRESRVHKTAAGEKCLAFCNLAPDAPRIQLDAGYLPCWAVLNEVKTCFRQNIEKSG